MKSARVRSSSLHESNIAQQQRFPVSGRVRPGIKVLTRAAQTGIPGAAKIYNDGIAAGASFDEIEKAIKGVAPKFTRSPLAPSNSSYFRREGVFRK